MQTAVEKQHEQARYRYDALNRLIQIADSTGSVRNIAYGKTANAQRPRNQSAFRTLKDDFGREVMIKSASHGTLIKRYDETDQLIEQINDKGDTQTWAYSLTGQRTRHSVLPKTGTQQTTTWRHEQGRLAEVHDPEQSERLPTMNAASPKAKPSPSNSPAAPKPPTSPAMPTPRTAACKAKACPTAARSTTSATAKARLLPSPGRLARGPSPPRQNSCRLDMILNLGAIRKSDGTVRRRIQE